MPRKRVYSEEWSSEDDDSDAGSLKDFIASDGESEDVDDSDDEFVPDSEESSEESSTEGDDEASGDDDDDDDEVVATPVIPTAMVGTRRRSGRVSKAPERYIDEDYVRLMTADVEVDAIFAPSSEEDDDDGEVEEEEEEEDEEEEEEEKEDEEEECPPPKRPRVHLVKPTSKAIPSSKKKKLKHASIAVPST